MPVTKFIIRVTLCHIARYSYSPVSASVSASVLLKWISGSKCVLSGTAGNCIQPKLSVLFCMELRLKLRKFSPRHVDRRNVVNLARPTTVYHRCIMGVTWRVARVRRQQQRLVSGLVILHVNMRRQSNIPTVVEALLKAVGTVVEVCLAGHAQ